jgi:hypothetical protein
MNLMTSTNGCVPCRGVEAYGMRAQELILLSQCIPNENQPKLHTNTVFATVQYDIVHYKSIVKYASVSYKPVCTRLPMECAVVNETD